MYEYLLTDKCRRLVLQQYSQPVAATPSLVEFTQRMMIPPGWKSGDQTQKQSSSNIKVDYSSAEHHHKCQPDERKVTVKHYFMASKITFFGKNMKYFAELIEGSRIFQETIQRSIWKKNKPAEIQ